MEPLLSLTMAAKEKTQGVSANEGLSVLACGGAVGLHSIIRAFSLIEGRTPRRKPFKKAKAKAEPTGGLPEICPE